MKIGIFLNGLHQMLGLLEGDEEIKVVTKHPETGELTEHEVVSVKYGSDAPHVKILTFKDK